jgi:hypothetical protein
MIKTYSNIYFRDFIKNKKNYNFYEYEIRKEISYKIKDLTFFKIGYDNRFDLFISTNFEYNQLLDENSNLSFLIDKKDKEVHLVGLTFKNKYHCIREYYFNMSKEHYSYLKLLVKFLLKNQEIFEFKKIILHHNAYYRSKEIDYNKINLLDLILMTEEKILYQDISFINDNAKIFLKKIKNCQVKDINWKELLFKLKLSDELNNFFNENITKFYDDKLSKLINEVFIKNKTTELLENFYHFSLIIFNQLHINYMNETKYFILELNNGI